jgi:NDP-sugar pyrophosphorylase family protein
MPLAPLLQARGHEMIDLDTGYHRDGWLFSDPKLVLGFPRSINRVIRTIEKQDLAGVDTVVYIAELSNDLSSENTFSYSVYGVAERIEPTTERAPVHPLTAYAQCKTLVERHVGEVAGPGFSPTSLRNATAYMATYCDGVTDIAIDAPTRFAVEQDRIGTVASVTTTSRFGNIEVDGGIVTTFNEKQDAGGGSINGGFFIFKRQFFDIAEKHGDVMLEREPMDELVELHQLAAYRPSGFWESMDTMREYRLLNGFGERGVAKWKI